MAITEALRLVVDADTRGAVQGIEKLGRTADRELSRSSDSLDKWGNRLTNIGASLIGVGSVALVGLGAAAMASEEAHLSVVKLENTLSNMPKLAGESSQQFIDLADSIQDVTAADADAIVEAEALLGTFNLTAQEIKGITPLVVDYARKFGVDIPDAAVQVGKALDGQVGALKRNGVSIDEVLFKTDRYAAVQKALSEQVGGFAEAEGATFAGSLQRLKNELGDLAEGVGTGAVDAFGTLFGVVDAATGKLNEMSPSTQHLIGEIATFGSVGLIAAGGLSVLIGQTIKARQNFVDAAEGVQALWTRLGGLSGALGALSVLGPLAVGAGIALKAYSDTKAEATRITDKYVDALKDEANATDAATDAVTSSELLKGDLGSSLRRAGADIELFNDAIRTSGDEIEDLDNAIDLIREIGLDKALDKGHVSASELTDELQRLGETMPRAQILDLIDRLDGLSDRYDDASESSRNTRFAEAELADQHGESASAIDGVTAGLEEATSAAQEYQDTIRAMLDPLFGAVHASEQLADANGKVTEAEFAVAEAIQEHGAGSLEAMAAQDELTRAEVDAASAAMGQEAAMITLSEAVGNGTVSLQAAKDKLALWVAQGLITQASADATAAKFDEVTGSALAVPTSVSTTVTAPGAIGSRIEIQGVGAALNDIDGRTANVTVKVTATGQQALNLINQKLLGFDVGGVVPGTKGSPQLVLAHGGETIVPTHDPGAMRSFMPGPFTGGGGGGGTYNDYRVINIQTGADPQGVVEALQRYERSNGSGWRN